MIFRYCCHLLMNRPLFVGKDRHGFTTRLCCAMLLLVTGFASDIKAANQPNVIVVLIDDMGWGDFSCFGNAEAKTPHIDRIASEGIRFEQFYVNAPICSPSRCALVTGQYPQRWNIHSYLNNRADNRRRGCAQWLDSKAITLPRLLKQNGYATGHFGKWHLGGQRDVDDAPAITEYGFDTSLTNFEGMGPKLLPLTQKPGDAQPGRIWQDAERLGGPVQWMPRSQITGGFTRAAIEFAKLARSQEKPFYINLWPDDVHSPFWPPVDSWPSQDVKPVKRAMYSAVLESMDRQLGELFDFLASDPEVAKNTILLICSDNGPEAQAGSAGPFRNGKTSLYEGGIRSPLIVWGPGLIAPKCHGLLDRESMFAAIDLMPSLLEICDIEAKEIACDGESVAGALLGRENRTRAAPLFWRRPPDRKTYLPESLELLPDLAVRQGKWKLLCNYDGSEVQLYDLQSDRGETNNLAGTADVASEHERTIARLRAELLAWHQAMPADTGVELGRSAMKRVMDSKKSH